MSSSFVIHNVANVEGAVYDQFMYSDGAMQVRIKPEFIERIKEADPVIVCARIQSPADLIELLLLKSALNEYTDARLVLPFMPYARADRRFVEGDCAGLEAIDRIIRMAGWESILTLDAHNEKALGSYTDSLPPDYFALESMLAFWDLCGKPAKINILFPDKGARERYHFVQDGSMVGSNHGGFIARVLNADKDRDPVTGKLKGFRVPSEEDLGHRPTLIIDDICDAGGTFIGIAFEIEKHSPGIRMGLYVTHGIFSRGLFDLYNYFEAIYTTNSFIREQDEDGRTPTKVYDACEYLIKEAVRGVR